MMAVVLSPEMIPLKVIGPEPEELVVDVLVLVLVLEVGEMADKWSAS